MVDEELYRKVLRTIWGACSHEFIDGTEYTLRRGDYYLSTWSSEHGPGHVVYHISAGKRLDVLSHNELFHMNSEINKENKAAELKELFEVIRVRVEAYRAGTKEKTRDEELSALEAALG